ncbi:MAG: hypothetical protein LUG13_00610 [Oscillospiraceae bacterium]|nr:hypothetical protein [Oscillospiraceae bacterium]
MKRKALAILPVACLLLTMTACTQTPAPSPSAAAPVDSAPPEITSTPSPEPIPASTAPVSVAPANLGSTLAEPIQVSLGDVTYSFPGSTFADFEANGWVMDSGSQGSTLGSNYTTSVDYTNGESKIRLTASNSASAPVLLNECELTALVVSSQRDLDNMTFIFPGGIAAGSTADEVAAVYGEPPSFYDNKDGERLSMEYKFDDCRVKFQFFEGGLNSFDIRC